MHFGLCTGFPAAEMLLTWLMRYRSFRPFCLKGYQEAPNRVTIDKVEGEDGKESQPRYEDELKNEDDPKYDESKIRRGIFILL